MQFALRYGTSLAVGVRTLLASILLIMPVEMEPARQNVNEATGPGYKVKVALVLEAGKVDGTQTYKIQGEYGFDGLDNVYISGIGSCPPKGVLDYINFGPIIEFRKESDSPILARVALQPTGVAMGDDSMDLPSEKEYPDAYSQGKWTKPKLFSTRASEVIQKYFPLGYAARPKGSQTYLVTTFRALDVSDQNIRSQIALVVSQPYNEVKNTFEYRVQIVARDRPRLSSTYRYADDRSPQTLKAAEDFLKRILRELGSSN